MRERTVNGVSLLMVAADGPPLADESDALDIISQTYGTGAQAVVIPAGRFSDAFFDLSTRQAGSFFQKLQTYHLRLIVIGDIESRIAASKSLADFVRETNRTGHHLFVPDHASLERALR
jgi:hypothetical protein